jgi:hypothetical protein
MDESWIYRVTSTSVLADLGPLPEVVESNSETSWNAFLQAQASQERSLATRPRGAPEATLSVQEVMSEARRNNRICPRVPHWQALCALLGELTGAQPPGAISGNEAKQAPPLVKRIRVRDQVEWAARHGQLPQVLRFFQSLPEDRWHHMQD